MQRVKFSLSLWHFSYLLNAVKTFVYLNYTNLQCLAVVLSWSLTSLFSTNTAISETKGQGWKVIRTQ